MRYGGMDAASAQEQTTELNRPGLKQLAQWMRTLVDYVRSGRPELTNRQMALMMTVYISAGPHTVRGLAEALHVSKPVITRALNKLSAKISERRLRFKGLCESRHKHGTLPQRVGPRKTAADPLRSGSPILENCKTRWVKRPAL